jgi:hypothetical protein
MVRAAFIDPANPDPSVLAHARRSDIVFQRRPDGSYIFAGSRWTAPAAPSLPNNSGAPVTGVVGVGELTACLYPQDTLHLLIKRMPPQCRIQFSTQVRAKHAKAERDDVIEKLSKAAGKAAKWDKLPDPPDIRIGYHPVIGWFVLDCTLKAPTVVWAEKLTDIGGSNARVY